MTASDTADDRFTKVCEDLKLSVKLHSAETYVDVDSKEFTMYIIEVAAGASGGRAGEMSWVLHRRYSQFNELKNRMEKLPGYKEAIGALKFPGKVFFSKTSTKVVEERKVALMDWTNKLLESEFTTNYHINSFLEAVDDEVLNLGQSVPSAVWTDVNDEMVKTDDFPKEGLVVMAAASYWTYQALTAFLDPACEAAMKKYPSLKQYNVGISELRLVPSAVRGQVRPVLAMLIKNAQSKSDAMVEKCGAPAGSNVLRFFPDWDASIIQSLGAKDCDWTWRVWVVSEGKVLTALRSSTPEGAAEFVKAFDTVAQAQGIEAKE